MDVRRGWLWVWVGLMVLGGGVRLWRLDSNPPYYADECVYASIARTTAEGEPRYGALRWPFARESNAKPPLWFLLDAPLQWLPGSAVVKARLLSALVSILLLPVLVGIGRRIHSPTAGVLAAWVSLVHAPMLLYGRWAMPYTLAGLFNALVVWAVILGWTAGRTGGAEGAPAERQPQEAGPEPFAARWALPLAGCAAGLSVVTDFFSVQACLFVFLYAIFRRRWRVLPWVAAGIVVPTVLFVAWGVSVRGAAFLRELISLFVQLDSAPGAGTALRQVLSALGVILLHDPVTAVGVIGLAIGSSQRRGRPLVWFLVCMLPLIVLRQGLDREFPHNATSYAFVFHLGCGVALSEAALWIRKRFASSRAVAGARMSTVVVTLPLLVLTAVALIRTGTQIPMGAKALGSVRDMAVTRDLAQRLNADLDPDDLAVVPERLIPWLNCRAVTPAQMLVAEGERNVTWYRYATPDEFAFPVSLARARVVVLDAWDRLNGMDPFVPGSRDPFLRLLRGARWQLAAVQGEYLVLRPPRRM